MSPWKPLLAGIVIGVAGTVAAYFFVHRDTVVYEARETVVAEEGIVIPAGTKLIHEAAMSEGFDTLRLYINVDPLTAKKKFTRSVDQRPLLVIPYWVAESGAGAARMAAFPGEGKAPRRAR